jgi:hypothetical protein
MKEFQIEKQQKIETEKRNGYSSSLGAEKNPRNSKTSK